MSAQEAEVTLEERASAVQGAISQCHCMPSGNGKTQRVCGRGVFVRRLTTGTAMANPDVNSRDKSPVGQRSVAELWICYKTLDFPGWKNANRGEMELNSTAPPLKVQRIPDYPKTRSSREDGSVVYGRPARALPVPHIYNQRGP
ncbi:hypothetical protein Bbelb_058680 [Branchiostoma belcheri]|nr:hypothetical protein Bbelb_058680 [Branchiostoma belcheri]